MLDSENTRLARRDRTRGAIVDVAWELARRDGLGALSLRELAARVGMRAPSLYTYFPSKNDLYDAMYAQGMRAFADRLSTSRAGRDPQQTFRNRVKTWMAAAVEDPLRYELLFHRPVPGFVPSPESLAIGLTAFAETRQSAEAAGLRGDRAFDLFVATTRGLVDMQNANEPGGDRWVRLLDEAMTMLLTHFAPTRRRSTLRGKDSR